MSDTNPSAGRDAFTNLDRAQALEAIVLLAQRLTRDLATAPALASRSLTTQAYAVLAGMAVDQGSPVAKIAKRAVPMSADLREVRQSLVAAGLIAEVKDAKGAKAGFALTDQGKAAVVAIRAELTEKLARVPEKSWRAVSRSASLIGAISKGVSGPRVKKAATPRQPKAPAPRKAKA